MNKNPKRDWRAVNLRLPQPIAERIAKMLEAKPHWSQQAILIDVIEVGLATMDNQK